MRIREVIEVRRPLEEAFAYVADFTTMAEWDPGIAEARRITDGPIGIGTEFDVVALFRGSRVPFRYRVTAYEENRRIVLDGEGAKARSTDEITFEPAAAGTRIVYEAELRLRGVRRALELFLGVTFEEMGRKAMVGLKAALDGGG
jgi:carbon monoxide dehydrogenase subunit G